jgi:hypothetical protein
MGPEPNPLLVQRSVMIWPRRIGITAGAGMDGASVTEPLRSSLGSDIALIARCWRSTCCGR